MENKCAGAIAHFLVSMLPEIKAKERVIKYGVELIITASVGLLLAAFVSLIAGKPIAWIAFILGFAPLRTTAGGFHASSHLGCYIITTTTFAVSVTFSLIGNVTVWHYIIISTLSSIVMLILSPIAAMNKPLSPTKRLANRYISLLIIGLELVVSLLW